MMLACRMALLGRRWTAAHASEARCGSRSSPANIQCCSSAAAATETPDCKRGSISIRLLSLESLVSSQTATKTITKKKRRRRRQRRGRPVMQMAPFGESARRSRRARRHDCLLSKALESGGILSVRRFRHSPLGERTRASPVSSSAEASPFAVKRSPEAQRLGDSSAQLTAEPPTTRGRPCR